VRIAVTVAWTFIAATAAAQQPQRRAPLADVGDLEPAVDVGAPVPRSTAPAGISPPAASSAAALPTATEGAVAPARTAATERPASRVMDALDLGTTSITGNAELPKVLYIVPWKKSDLGDLVGRPVNTLLDEVLAPVDREVFERHLSYYETLHGEGGEE
jgi:hypothetical protein